MKGPRGLDVRIADGSSQTLIVLVHGFTASKDANFFPQLFDRLSERCSVVALDLSAHGKSEGRFEDITFPDLEADIEAVIDEYAQGREVVIVGHSMGASLAYRIAARRHVAGLVMLAPGFEVRSTFLLKLRKHAFENGSATFTDGFGRERTVSAAFFTSRDYDPLELASRIAVPALVICGELDYTVSNDTCRKVAEAIGARFEVIEDAGHTFGDSDEEIGPLIVSFLEGLPGDCF